MNQQFVDLFLDHYNDEYTLTGLDQYQLTAIQTAISLGMFYGEFSERAALFLEDLFEVISLELYPEDPSTLEETLTLMEYI
jgi:hypothetical protein